MRLIYRWLSAGLTTCVLHAVPAQAESLLEVYQQAQDSDPTLRRAASDRLADREAKPQAKALLLPRLDGTASLQHSFDQQPPNGGDTSFDSRSVTVQLRQSLYNRGDWARFKQADFVLDQADANYENVADQLILRVSQAYFNVLSAGDDLIFTQADKNATARQLEQAKQRFEVGLITITAVQEAQARFDSVSADEIVARNALADRNEELRLITGSAYPSLSKVSDKLPLTPPDPDASDPWVELALANNPQLNAANAGVDIARKNIDVQQSGHYPNVDLVASYDDSRSNNRDSNGGQIGVQLNVPLFSGFGVSSRVRQAAYQLEAAKETLEVQRRSVVNQVLNAYRGVLAAISQVRALDQARRSTQSALEATEAGFDVGTRTIVDVLNAQRDVFRAQRNYSQARYVYILNTLNLKQAAGVIDVADLEQLEAWLTPD